MRSILHFKTISELTSQFRLGKINHPLVAVVDFTTVVDDLPANTRINADFYAVMFKNYCSNHIKYGRKSITRTSVHSDLVTQVENYLTDYFNDTSVSERGLPTVRSLANKLHISPSYLSDLLKKETGMSAQQHIHHYIIEEAKTVLLNSNASVSEVVYSLGFAYPQYFSRIFKEKTGKSPIAFRENN